MSRGVKKASTRHGEEIFATDIEWSGQQVFLADEHSLRWPGVSLFTSGSKNWRIAWDDVMAPALLVVKPGSASIHSFQSSHPVRRSQNSKSTATPVASHVASHFNCSKLPCHHHIEADPIRPLTQFAFVDPSHSIQRNQGDNFNFSKLPCHHHIEAGPTLRPFWIRRPFLFC